MQSIDHKNWRWNYNTGGGQLLDWIGPNGWVSAYDTQWLRDVQTLEKKGELKIQHAGMLGGAIIPKTCGAFGQERSDVPRRSEQPGEAANQSDDLRAFGDRGRRGPEAI
jgi:hypothetical protein